MAPSGYGHLKLDERRSLFRFVEARLNVAEIAACLGRHRSTIYRELGRNRFRDRDHAGDRWCDMSGHYPVMAQDQALARRCRQAKLARHKGLRAHVVDRLRAGWSPQQIAGRLQLDGANGDAGERLCHETIYRHVYGPEGRSEQLYLCLPRAQRRRATRHGRRPRGHRIPQGRGIACRPAEVATRASFGHWEGDLLIFARDGGCANVTTLLERRSRYVVLLPNPDRRPAGVAERIGAALGGLATDLRRTVTFDRGFEPTSTTSATAPDTKRDILIGERSDIPISDIQSTSGSDNNAGPIRSPDDVLSQTQDACRLQQNPNKNLLDQRRLYAVSGRH